MKSAVNEWFSDVLANELQARRDARRNAAQGQLFLRRQKDDHVSFADAYPFLLIGENSLADLNSRLAENLPMNRFRPNFVVSDSEGFAEDAWKKIKIGASVFHVVKPCARCVMTTIEQTTGEKQVTNLENAGKFRIPKRSVKKKILFGQNLIAENAGDILRVGDKIEVLETKRSPKFL